jgi:hypothetical protein
MTEKIFIILSCVSVEQRPHCVYGIHSLPLDFLLFDLPAVVVCLEPPTR